MESTSPDPPVANPVVSPADTHKFATPRPWKVNPGSVSIITSEDGLTEVSERHRSRMSSRSQADAALIVQAVNERDALLADRERDRRKVEAYDAARAEVKIEGHTRAYYVLRAQDAEADRERDRQQIAQLTEALDARPITREHAFRAAQNAVRSQGYAVALHGSQIKDLDLIAVPWQETALTAQDVAELIAAAIPGFIEKGSPETMPNGRLSFTIRPNWHYGFDHWWIDLAVMPRECDWSARAVLAGKEEARP